MASVTLQQSGEDEVVRRITAALSAHRDVVVGPGDDCAAVKFGSRRWLQLLKTDCLVEGIHFLPDEEPRRIGWKALARAISDIAACAGKPQHALVTVAAPGEMKVSRLEGIYDGLNQVADQFGISIIGGETSRSPGPLFLSIALTGRVRADRMITRSGGQAGDQLFVTGRLGGSLGGRHLDFVPRVLEALWLAKNFPIRAMMDLSDGLGCDLPRLADASRTGFTLDLSSLPLHEGSAVENAIQDGEDYELLFAVEAGFSKKLAARWSRKFPGVPLTAIGQLEADSAHRTRLPSGFSHFSGCQIAPVSG